jgi:hypothetical protein
MNLCFIYKRALPAASGGLLSFGLSQKKVTKEKLKSRTQPTHIATTLVYETGLTEPLRGWSAPWADGINVNKVLKKK